MFGFGSALNHNDKMKNESIKAQKAKARIQKF
jgi:hypothetical protein